MTDLALNSWWAWAPGCPNRDDWKTDRPPESYLRNLEGSGVPDVDWIPSRKRRRCSNLTRIALHVAVRCCREADIDPGQVKTVFSTRHGEMSTTFQLLNSLADDELISPMSFGNSVHNTPSSYFCICTDNTNPSRTVSACEETFQHGFLDAAGLLNILPEMPVLFVHAHTALPEPLSKFEPFQNTSYGTAFLFDTPNTSEDGITLSLEPENSATTFRVPAAIAFLRWYLHGDNRLLLPRTNSSLCWTWCRQEPDE